MSEQRLRPVRGLILAQNVKGKSLARADLRRWFRLNRTVFKTDKVDVLALGGLARLLPDLLACGRELDMRVSLRTDACAAPPDLNKLREQGLYDLFLVGAGVETHFDDWLDACREAGLPFRVQLQPPLIPNEAPERIAERLANAGAVAVNIAAFDPFTKTTPCRDTQESRRTLARMNTLVAALDTHDIEANLLRVPFCLVTKENQGRTLNSRQFFLDHQQYHRRSYELAERLYRRRPAVIGKCIIILLGQHTFFKNPIDQKLLPWLIDSPWLRARVWAWHKLTRHLRLTRSIPKPADTPPEEFGGEVQRLQARAQRAMGPLCGKCSLRLICDRETRDFKRAMPGLRIDAQEGNLVVWPLHFAVTQPKHYDSIDAARRDAHAIQTALAEQANAVVREKAPAREIDSFDYSVEGQWCHQLPGGVRWYGFTNTEKTSTPLARLNPPFTLAAVFGGGMAEYIGFGFGRHCRLVCPMEAYRHRLVLHVSADGDYVLLRDGSPVRPVEFEGAYYAPARLGNELAPRLSIWNIDGSIVTQNVQVWEQDRRPPGQPRTIVFSVIIVCVRYARRLQACLINLMHQRDVDLRQVELIVAYVPGIDATEDVLEGLEAVFPDVRIVRAPFSERYAAAKGFMINEALQMASGEWVVLLDADILVPPGLFAEIQRAGDDVNFIAPDGRKLLTQETTARILLGAVEPWRDWHSLLREAGEFRYREMDGVPLGFCQCVRRSCLEKVRYYEADHFEGADWQFAVDMRNEFGKERRLSGMPALHLEHGGSKWYGADRQR